MVSKIYINKLYDDEKQKDLNSSKDTNKLLKDFIDEKSSGRVSSLATLKQGRNTANSSISGSLYTGTVRTLRQSGESQP